MTAAELMLLGETVFYLDHGPNGSALQPIPRVAMIIQVHSVEDVDLMVLGTGGALAHVTGGVAYLEHVRKAPANLPAVGRWIYRFEATRHKELCSDPIFDTPPADVVTLEQPAEPVVLDRPNTVVDGEASPV